MGVTAGSLEGPNAGQDDAFVRKYDAAGGLLWTRQFGTSTEEGPRDVSADGLGNVYLSGNTKGSLGGPNAGGDDAFLAKFSEAPEPATAMLVATGLVFLFIPRGRWRRC